MEIEDPQIAELYDELRSIAHRRLAEASARAGGTTLNTTELVHEAYLKLVPESASNRWRDRAHFLAAAAVAMRHILVDRARARATTKRGRSSVHITVDDNALTAHDEPELLLEIDDALERLAAITPRLAELVVLRFYGGMTDQEVADALGVTRRTVQRDWLKARALLQRSLSSDV